MKWIMVWLAALALFLPMSYAQMTPVGPLPRLNGTNAFTGVNLFSGTTTVQNLVVTGSTTLAVPATTTVTASQISDAGTAGRAVVTATSAAAARGAMEIGRYINGVNYSITNTHNDHNGSDTKGMCRAGYFTGKGGVSAAKISFSNIPEHTHYTAEVTNPFTLRCSLEYPEGTFHPAFINGVRDATLPVGSIVTFDSIDVEIPENTQFWIRTFVTVAASGQKWYESTAINVNGRSGGYIKGASATDLTTSGTIPDGIAYAPAPIAISTLTATGKEGISVAILGDSIAEPADLIIYPAWHLSFVSLPLYNAGIAWMNSAANGGTVTDLYGSADSKQLLGFIGRNNSHVICELGTNNIVWDSPISSLDALKASYLKLWGFLAKQGASIYQTTITPDTTSTDSWATTANQTVLHAESESLRVAINDWIRTCPAPLSGYFDSADRAETARNSGIWKATGAAFGYTKDGVHPNSAGTVLLSGAIDVSKFQ